MTSSIPEQLARAAFLDGASSELVEELAARTTIVDVGKDECIIAKGDLGSRMYFISSGKVRVHDGDVVLAHLGPGEVIGEMGLLDPEVRTASVSAECDTKIIALERDDFYAGLERHPEAFRVVIRSILRRERTLVRDVTQRTERLLGYEKELEIGRRIQESFLPERIPDLDNFEIDTYFEAAREVAGDYFDLFPVNGGARIGVVIGDVCDKGVGAALFMTLFRSLLRAYALFDSAPCGGGATRWVR